MYEHTILYCPDRFCTTHRDLFLLFVEISVYRDRTNIMARIAKEKDQDPDADIIDRLGRLRGCMVFVWNDG